MLGGTARGQARSGRTTTISFVTPKCDGDRCGDAVAWCGKACRDARDSARNARRRLGLFPMPRWTRLSRRFLNRANVRSHSHVLEKHASPDLPQEAPVSVTEPAVRHPGEVCECVCLAASPVGPAQQKYVIHIPCDGSRHLPSATECSSCLLLIIDFARKARQATKRQSCHWKYAGLRQKT